MLVKNGRNISVMVVCYGLNPGVSLLMQDYAVCCTRAVGIIMLERFTLHVVIYELFPTMNL